MTLARLSLVLPLAACLLLWGLVTAHRTRLGMGRLSARGALVLAFLASQWVVVALTELLSLGHDLTRGPLAAAWSLVVVAAVAAGLRSGGAAAVLEWWRVGGLRRWWHLVVAAPTVVRVASGAVLAMVAALVVEALAYLPNNPDSLVYHLARVAHWVQDASVEHYATHSLAQLELAPLHELNMLHLHVLGGTDRLDGLVQLAAYAVIVIGASELARLLGATTEVQVLAAVVAAATPSALLEAASTQNNLFAAAVGVGLLVIVLAWQPGEPIAAPALLLGLTLGSAVLAKGTLLALLGPAVLLVCGRVAWSELRTSSARAVGRRLGGVALVATVGAVALAGPFLARNLELFDGVGGPVTRVTVSSDTSVRASAGNVVRSAAVNFRVGRGGSDVESVTSRAALAVLGQVHEWVGAPIDDPAFSLGPPVDVFEGGDLTEYARNEDFGANPWHALLVVVAGAVLVVRWARDHTGARAALVAVGLVAGFVAFTGTARFSLYVTRYQLPLLVAWAPLIAIALASLHRHVLRAAALLLVVASLPALLDNGSRPLLERPQFASKVDRYFAPSPSGQPPLVPPADYVALRDAVVASGCDRIGIGNTLVFEYPLWVALEEVGWRGEVRAVAVQNESRVLEDPDFEPCAVVRQKPWQPRLEPLEGMVELDFGALRLSLTESTAS